MAPTDSPATDSQGQVGIFTGTSAATPNMAGIASLVWSADPELTAPDVRNILQDTAMQPKDLPGGSGSFDSNYGYGLVDADTAVRRAVALKRNFKLAILYDNDGSILTIAAAADLPAVNASGAGSSSSGGAGDPNAGSFS